VCAPALSGLATAAQLPADPAERVRRLVPRLAAPPRPLSPTLPPPLSPPLPPHFLRSIRPALECAFGTEDEAHVPEALAALVARLRASAEPGAADARAVAAEA
jgi:hypothetical protein